MKQRTWPDRSDASPFSSFSLSSVKGKAAVEVDDDVDHFSRHANSISISISSKFPDRLHASPSTSSSSQTPFFLPPSSFGGQDFSALPYDVLIKIAASFNLPNLRAASFVCKPWFEALRPLREAMLFLRWGKRFKHGRAGVRPNSDKALNSFLKAAARGSTLAMVDAGLLYWEMGNKGEAIALYQKAADLGDPAGKCNLGISFLHAKPPNPTEAVRWLRQSAMAGNIRAQYQLALCLHQGHGVDRNVQEAARWFLKAAEGGYVRAMYNLSLCYSCGEGLVHNHQQAKKWMKRAADRGHSKAQFEHGLHLFSERDMMKAVVYLELATRSGERAAAHVKNVILQQLSQSSRDRVMSVADNWRALPSSH
ncbi:F-box protein [Cucurbita argyrosperma subsp. argyrosperma]|nr:F-box protein [Cucurbita argyrosperma subsp. argyrosperma]